MTGSKARPRTWFNFNLQKRPVPESSGALWQWGLILRVGLRLDQVAGSLLAVVSLPVLLTLGRRGAVGVHMANVSHSTALSSSSVIQFGMHSHFWISRGALLPTSLCLTWFRVTIFSLAHILPLFHNLQQFNIKAASSSSHYPEVSGWAAC